MYAFTHAHQLAAYPGFFDACENDFANSSYSAIRSRAIERYHDLDNHIHQDPDGSIPYGPSGMTIGDLFSKSEILFWKLKGKSVYKKYYEARTHTWATDLMNLNENSTDAAKLLNLLQEWENSRCVFSGFTLPQRIKALKVLSHGGQSWWKNFDNNEEDVYNYILRTTPDEAIISILAIFKDSDYALFRRVANKMENSWVHQNDKTGLEPFMGHLAHMVLKKEFKSGYEVEEIGGSGQLKFNIGSDLDHMAEENGHFIGSNSIFYDLHCYRSTFISPDRYELLSRHFEEPSTCASFNADVVSLSDGLPFDYVGLKFEETTIIKTPLKDITVEAGNHIIIHAN